MFVLRVKLSVFRTQSQSISGKNDGLRGEVRIIFRPIVDLIHVGMIGVVLGCTQQDKIRYHHVVNSRHPSYSGFPDPSKREKNMRAVIQRVLSASVTGSFLCPNVISALVEYRSPVNSKIVSEISRGLMVLVGIGVGT